MTRHAKQTKHDAARAWRGTARTMTRRGMGRGKQSDATRGTMGLGAARGGQRRTCHQTRPVFASTGMMFSCCSCSSEIRFSFQAW